MHSKRCKLELVRDEIKLDIVNDNHKVNDNKKLPINIELSNLFQKECENVTDYNLLIRQKHNKNTMRIGYEYFDHDISFQNDIEYQQ